MRSLSQRRVYKALFRRLSPEELAKVKPLKDEDIDRALAEGRDERERAETFVRRTIQW